MWLSDTVAWWAMSTTNTKKRVTFADPAPTPDGHSSLATCTQNTVVNGSSPSSTLLGQPQPHGVQCVCLSTKESGHLIECEHCFHWCHSKCIGISQPVAKNYPLICPYCTSFLLQEVLSLWSKVSSITSEIAVLQSQLSSASQTSQSLHSSPEVASPAVGSGFPSDAPPPTTGHSRKNQLSHPRSNSLDRQFNLVLFGIGEQVPGTPRATRLREDSTEAPQFCLLSFSLFLITLFVIAFC